MKMKLPYRELKPFGIECGTFEGYIFKQGVPFDIMGFKVLPGEVERVGSKWVWVITEFGRNFSEFSRDRESDICLTTANITRQRDKALKLEPCIVEVVFSLDTTDGWPLSEGGIGDLKPQYKVRFWDGEVLVVVEPMESNPLHWFYSIDQMHKSGYIDFQKLYQLFKPSNPTEVSNMGIDLLSMCQSKEERITVEAGILLCKAEEQIRYQIVTNNTYDKYQHVTTPKIQGMTVYQLYDALEKGLREGSFKSQLTVKYDPPSGPSLGDHTEYPARIVFELKVR